MFIFKLQSLLDYRRRKEEEARGEFSDVSRRLQQEELKLAAFACKRRDLEAQLKGAEKRRMKASDISLCCSIIARIQEEEQRQKAVIEETEAKLEEKRQGLHEASKKRQTVERLQERQLAEYRRATVRAEQKELDELTVLKFKKGKFDEESDHSL